MTRRPGFHTVLALLVIFTSGAPASGIVIDDFSVGPFVVNGPDQLDQAGLDPTHVIGGTRRIDVGQFGVGSRLEVTDAGHLRLSSTGNGYFEVTYGAVEPLGGMDLTQGGHDRLLIRFADVGPGFHPFGIYVSLPSSSSSNGESMYVRDTWDGVLVEIPYSKFPVPFTAVQSITLDGFRNPSGSGFSIDSIFTGGPSVAGDYNRDGVVDAADLAEWQLAAGNSGTSGGSGASFTADGDQDGDVDGSDFLVWQQNLGASYSPPGLAVPEPISAIAAVAAVVALTPLGRRFLNR